MKVLVVAAHPDDEILGLGGTTAKHVRAGDSVSVVIVATGATSRAGATETESEAEVLALRACAAAAARVLGTDAPVFLGLPDNRLDSIALLDLVQALESECRRVDPEIIYTHHHADLNIDHRLVHQAVMTAARPLPGSRLIATYCFETPSSTEWGDQVFRPQRFVDIAETLDQKLRALRCYASEMRAFPHPRSEVSIEALARVRGAESGLAAAEAFEVRREICR